jgi:hypothetical protein
MLLLEFLAVVLPLAGGLAVAMFAPQFVAASLSQQHNAEFGVAAFGLVCSVLIVTYNRLSSRQHTEEMFRALTGRDNYCWFEADLKDLAAMPERKPGNQLFITSESFVPHPNCYACDADTGGDIYHKNYARDKPHRRHERTILRAGGPFKSDIFLRPGKYIIQINTQFSYYEEHLRFGWWHGKPYQVWELYKGAGDTKLLKQSDRHKDFREADLLFQP